MSVKNKTLKNIRRCCYIALTFCAAWTILMGANFFQIFTNTKIEWSENTIVKIVLVAAYLISCSSAIYLCVKFILNILKGLSENTAFPKSNVKLLFWLTLTCFIYLLCTSNEPILYDEFSFDLVSTNFVAPLILLLFAFMYKIAADAVEENNLTI